MRLVSAAFACRNRILRKFKNIPQERIVRNLTTQSRHRAHGNILRSLKGSGSFHKSNFLQPNSPIVVPAAGFLPFAALRVVGSVALRLTNVRYLILLGGTAGGVSVYKVCRVFLYLYWCCFTSCNVCLNTCKREASFTESARASYYSFLGTVSLVACLQSPASDENLLGQAAPP